MLQIATCLASDVDNNSLVADESEIAVTLPEELQVLLKMTVG